VLGITGSSIQTRLKDGLPGVPRDKHTPLRVRGSSEVFRAVAMSRGS